MDVTQVYGIVMSGIICMLLLFSIVPKMIRLFQYLSPVTLKHMTYRYILHRHRFLGPWSRAGVLLQLIYIAGTVVCLSLRLRRVDTQDSPFFQAGLRAGTLSLVNLVILIAAPHLAFLAGLLGISLSLVRQIHRSVGLMTVLLVVFHVLMAVVFRPSFASDVPRSLFAVIGASSLGGILLFSIPIFRRLSYELFLRSHQAFSALSVYAIWRHLSSGESVHIYNYCLYISVGLFLFLLIVQSVVIFYRNGIFQSGRAEVHLTHVHGAVKLRIQLRKPLKVEAGQHIILWMPSASFWAFTQSHPFMVISWAEKSQDHLDLLIEPRKGLTRELLRHAIGGRSTHSPVLFSGPHGKSVSMEGYDTVLMVASGFGIAAQLPYLKQLIHGYNKRQVHARRIHLVWQVRHIGVAAAAQTLLNSALEEDTLDDGRILSISIYCESNDIPGTSFGKRANVYPGKAPLLDILEAEVTRERIEEKPVQELDWSTQRIVDGNELESRGTANRDGTMLVTVSANNDIRDKLRRVVWDRLVEGLKFYELNYQPSE